MFTPDFNHIVSVARNKKPARLPLYEHLINPGFMEKLTSKSFADLVNGDAADLQRYFDCYCNFYKDMTYDTVSFEVCITDILPGHGAIMGGKKGPIQNRADFTRYPWDNLAESYWRVAQPQFECFARSLPAGMKGVGGVGNGVFEIAEDLVGFEYLCCLQADDPELFAELFKKIGDLMAAIWTRFLSRYADLYAVCRMGDDLGYKSGTMLQPSTIVEHVIPQYRRIISLVHRAEKPFLLHSCGCIFDVMDQLISAGIDAKHSNEDVIADFSRWIYEYNNRIGLFGGIDVDLLCRSKPKDVYDTVLEAGRKFRSMAKGYALGSGNSIPDYVPVDAYLAMIDAVQELRRRELQG